MNQPHATSPNSIEQPPNDTNNINERFHDSFEQPHNSKPNSIKQQPKGIPTTPETAKNDGTAKSSFRQYAHDTTKSARQISRHSSS
mmetsp:Transcript_5875/g.13067  ORF Transcript_5875/g.13067 Transcript_5875/m.13067 type:complete len:86 (+) Transcript_5875:1249-1506(+)